MISSSLLQTLRVLITGAALFAPLLVGRPARADIVLTDEPSFPRVDAAGKVVAARTPLQVNRLDCEEDQRIRFAIALSDFAPNGTLQAWASLDGADCTMATAREGSSPVCWKVGDDLPLAATTGFEPSLRALMSGALSPVSPSSTSDVCGQVDRTTISLQLLYFAPTTPSTPTWTKNVNLEVDTLGPAEPSAPNVEWHDDVASMRVSWEPEADPFAVETLVYCARLEADGQGCALTGVGASPGAPLRPSADHDASFLCADIVNLSSSVAIDRSPQGPLEPGQWVFVRATADSFGNVSPPSRPVCASIAPEASPGADGCSASGRASTMTPLALLSVAFFLLARRSRGAAPL